MDAPVAEVIAVTDKAARRIAALADKEGRTDPILRVRVTAGGCSASPTSSRSRTARPRTTP